MTFQGPQTIEPKGVIVLVMRLPIFIDGVDDPMESFG